jgi:hypothetical protein
MLGDLLGSQRAASLDQDAQEAPSVGQFSDPVGCHFIDTGVHKTRQEPVVSQNSHRGIACSHHLTRNVCDALKNGIDIEL